MMRYIDELGYLGAGEDRGKQPSMADVANAERAYAEAQRELAQAIADRAPALAAHLMLEADVCDMWADDMAAGNRFSYPEYVTVLDELARVQRGKAVPRGGLKFLVEHCRGERTEV